MAITIDGTNGLSSDNAALKLDGTTLVVDDTNNRVGVGTASPAVAMDVVGQVRASTGILFGSDTAAANALDDYEEGTFTPSWSSTSASFTYDASFRHGRYTKIGNTVYFNIYVSTSGAPTGTTSNSLTITGLPFTSGNTDNANICGLTFGLIYNVDWPTNKIMATANVSRNTTFVGLRWEQDSAISTDWTASNLLASCYVIVSGFYFV
jgi:hypothetical protein